MAPIIKYYVPLGVGLEIGPTTVTIVDTMITGDWQREQRKIAYQHLLDEMDQPYDVLRNLQILASVENWPGVQRVLKTHDSHEAEIEMRLIYSGAAEAVTSAVKEICEQGNTEISESCSNPKKTLVKIPASEIKSAYFLGKSGILNLVIRALDIPLYTDAGLRRRIAQAHEIIHADKACCVCLEDFAHPSQPRYSSETPVLFCNEGLHMLCLSCTTALMNREQLGQSMTCPICRRIVILVFTFCVGSAKLVCTGGSQSTP